MVRMLGEAKPSLHHPRTQEDELSIGQVCVVLESGRRWSRVYVLLVSCLGEANSYRRRPRAPTLILWLFLEHDLAVGRAGVGVGVRNRVVGITLSTRQLR